MQIATDRVVESFLTGHSWLISESPEPLSHLSTQEPFSFSPESRRIQTACASQPRPAGVANAGSSLHDPS